MILSNHLETNEIALIEQMIKCYITRDNVTLTTVEETVPYLAEILQRMDSHAGNLRQTWKSGVMIDEEHLTTMISQKEAIIKIQDKLVSIVGETNARILQKFEKFFSL